MSASTCSRISAASAEVEAALAAGAEGCGLLRTEFLFLDRATAPSQEEQRSTYQAIADALGERPLTIRTLDIGGDKPVPYIRFPPEENPALGARGVRTDCSRRNCSTSNCERLPKSAAMASR